ncbi:hypothetical protein TNCV_2745021 [Trichonephila clavipes]|nr:hypothetical protein TNCV_2745021 [Trichonephila clavipes]
MFTSDSPHTNTIAITAEIESGFVSKDELVPFRCSLVFSCTAPIQTEASVGGRQEQHTKGTTCAWLAVDEAVGCTRAFLTMLRSSRRLVCQGHPEPGLRVNGISRIHWFQLLLTTQSEKSIIDGLLA